MSYRVDAEATSREVREWQDGRVSHAIADLLARYAIATGREPKYVTLGFRAMAKLRQELKPVTVYADPGAQFGVMCHGVGILTDDTLHPDWVVIMPGEP